MSIREELDRLRREATPAPWYPEPMYPSHRETSIWGGPGRAHVVCECGRMVHGTHHPQDNPNAAYIVALANAYANGELVPRDELTDEAVREAGDKRAAEADNQALVDTWEAERSGHEGDAWASGE